MSNRNIKLVSIGLAAIMVVAIISCTPSKLKAFAELPFSRQLQLLVYMGKVDEAIEGCKEFDPATWKQRPAYDLEHEVGDYTKSCFKLAEISFNYFCKYRKDPEVIKPKPLDEVCANISVFVDRVLAMPGLEKEDEEYLLWLDICLKIWPDVVRDVDAQDIEGLREMVKQWYSRETQVFKYGRRYFTTSMSLLGDYINEGEDYSKFSKEFLQQVQNLKDEYLGEYSSPFIE